MIPPGPTAVPNWRTLPFGEHRSMRQVIEVEAWQELRKQRGWLYGFEAKKLQSLQARGTEPDSAA